MVVESRGQGRRLHTVYQVCRGRPVTEFRRHTPGVFRNDRRKSDGMSVNLEITDRDGLRTTTVDETAFWIGCDTESSVPIGIPDCASRVLEVKVEKGGRILIRAEAGLPFPVRCATGNIGDRFDSLLDGDVVNLGPAMVKIRYVSVEDGAEVAEELDLAAVQSPGTPIGSWYRTFMEVADHLEGLKDPSEMIETALGAVLTATSADRVHLSLDRGAVEPSEAGQRAGYFLARGDDRTPFRVSSSLIERVREGGRVVHVPVASEDPVASKFVSIRREGISSGIALPIEALGRRNGVLYADCVREGVVLSAEDLQRVVFIGRLLASALGNRDLVAGLVRAKPDANSSEHPALQSSSPGCAEMIERVKLYAPTDYTVLLRGETGVGKEVLARALHDLSRRSEKVFVPVNCAAIPEQLMESMLFGHEKGAFTGATQSRPGHFEEAHGGTLFLDEIGDMPIDLQAKILRVLQDRVVTPLGSRRQVKVDVRIIAATHQDLEQMIDERRFREDLYFRLNELEIRLPSLRERSEDLLMLCVRFLEEAARELNLDKVQDLTKDAVEALQRRKWRGNIRELRHLIKGAALRAQGGPIRVEDLGSASSQDLAEPALANPVKDSSSTWKERLDHQELLALRETLDKSQGNLTKGAELFGVPRTTYREKLVRHGLLKVD